MMNKSNIQWCDFSWSPITGCRKGCPYCFAEKIARRFSGDVRINTGDPQLFRCGRDGLWILEKPFKNASGKVLPYPAGFAPTYHKYRLTEPSEKKKPANIFVCAMSDMFGFWVPPNWIEEIFESCEAAPQHNYLFLTKNVRRYHDLAFEGKLPKQDNFWYGVTVTNEKGSCIWSLERKTFVSIEPLLGRIGVDQWSFGGLSKQSWIIIGAETGYRKGKIMPKREWIEEIVEQARKFHIPVFMKPSKEMEAVWNAPLIQEWPKELLHEVKVIPHCLKCSHCIEQEYHGGKSRFCDKAVHDQLTHIEARYTRSSPGWCPFRRG